MVADIARKTSDEELRKFLERFAFRNFDDFSVRQASRDALIDYEKSEKREGEFFRLLLLHLGREIDWMLCAEMEREFMK